VASSRTPSRIGCTATRAFEATAEQQLIQPTLSSTTRRSVTACAAQRRNRDVTDRFELYIAGREIANGFSELNDPKTRRRASRSRPGRSCGRRGVHVLHPTTSAPGVRLRRGREGSGSTASVMLFTNSRAFRDGCCFPICARKPKPSATVEHSVTSTVWRLVRYCE